MAGTNENPLQTDVAVITGASSGIGMATALQFAEDGYNVVLAARSQKELDTVAADCRERGVQAEVVAADTTDEKAVKSICEMAIRVFGHIDVWVNNAGAYMTGKFEDVPLEDMHRIMDTNFFGYVHGSRSALGQFRRQGYGTLINVSSVNAAAPQPYIGIYSASKAAVRALDESLRMELRLDGLEDGIHVCTVMPASIDTNIFQNAANYTGKEIQALEPVYDPRYVAKQIVHLAKHPKREIIVGPAGKMMAFQRAHMPHSYEKRMTKFTQADMIGDRPVTIGDGNLFTPGSHGMRGGWRQRRLRDDQLNAGIGIGLAAAAGLTALGIVLFRRNQRT